MKILLIVDSLKKGGKERRLTQLLFHLKRFGIEFKLIVLSCVVEYDIREIEESVIFLERKTKRDLLVFTKISKIINSFSPNVVHTWCRMSTVYCLPSILRNSLPLICSIINDVPFKKPSIFSRQAVENLVFSIFADRILSNTYAGLERNRISSRIGQVIHNGFDFNRLKNINPSIEIRSKYGINTKYVVAMVGAMEPRKDFDTYMDVAKDMCSLRFDITYLMVGGGRDLERVRESCHSFPNIKCLGMVSDVENIMSICDVGVLLSKEEVHGEGISNALLEFMALAKPVIATHGGGNPELIEDGISGYLIPNNDKNLITDRIEHYLSDDSVKFAHGLRSQQIVKEKFEMDIMTKAFLDLYDQLISEK